MALALAVLASRDLTPALRTDIVTLCSRAYEEDFAAVLATMPDIVHLCGHDDAALVSHLGWVTRWLQIGEGPLLRTAYVEAVATLPEAQGRGHATTLLAALPPLLGNFDLAALSPSDATFYERLGWRTWRGPRQVRESGRLIDTPGEEVMVLPLPNSPALDLDAPLSVEWRPGEVW